MPRMCLVVLIVAAWTIRGEGTARECAQSPRGDSDGWEHAGTIVAVAMFGLKMAAMAAVVTVKALLLKTLALAKVSVVVSVLLLARSIHSRVKQLVDTTRIQPSRYPQDEPDLSGFGYTNYGAEGVIAAAALNKTLASWQEKKVGALH